MCVKWNEAEENSEDEGNVGEDSGVHWYAVTVGKRVGVYKGWCVMFLSFCRYNADLFPGF